MNRFLITVSLCLLVVFTGIGLLFSRPWGWSEYTSPELYVIYEAAQQSASFFLVDAEGSGKRWELTSDSGDLTALNCSPDGHTLAFLTDSGHLYVANQAGVVYNRALGQGYDAITTANDGKTAIAKRDYGLVLIVSPEGSSLPIPPDHIAYDPIQISSSGAALWSHTVLGGIKLVVPAGETLFAVSGGAFSPIWLASEQMFAFSYWDRTSHLDGGLTDTAKQVIVRFRNGIMRYGILSPDAREQALPILDPTTNTTQVFIVDPLTGKPKTQLTDEPRMNHMPICFLTFRPQMLTS